MGTAAEFYRITASVNYPNHVAIFFSEQRHGACLFRIFDVHFFHCNWKTFKDFGVDLLFYLLDFFFCHGLKVREVKAPGCRLVTSCPA